MANKVVQLQNKDGDNLYPLSGGTASDSITTDMLQDGSVTSDKIDLATYNLLDYKTSIVTADGARAILSVKAGIGLITVAGTSTSTSGAMFDNIPVRVPFTQELAMCTNTANQNIRCVIENGTDPGTSKISVSSGIQYPANFYIKGAVLVES